MPSTHRDRDPIPDNPARLWRDPLGHVVRLNRVEPDAVRWLTPGRLAAGKITVLDGETPPPPGRRQGWGEGDEKAPLPPHGAGRPLGGGWGEGRPASAPAVAPATLSVARHNQAFEELEPLIAAHALETDVQRRLADNHWLPGAEFTELLDLRR